MTILWERSLASAERQALPMGERCTTIVGAGARGPGWVGWPWCPVLLATIFLVVLSMGGSLPLATAAAFSTFLGVLASHVLVVNRLREGGRHLTREGMGKIDGSRNEPVASPDPARCVVDSLTAGVITLDREGRVVLANSAVREVLCVDGSPLEGRELSDVIAEALRDRVVKGFEEFHRRNRQQVELVGIEWNGKVYDFTIAPVRSRQHDMESAAVILVADVTRKAETARLKDEFLSSISHELRTPLTGICASTEILQQIGPQGGDEWVEFLDILWQEGSRLRGLVDDILDYSSMESGDVAWETSLIDVEKLAETAVESRRQDAAGKDVTLGLSCGGGSLHAEGSQERIACVIGKLIDNALKFTPGPGRVEVSVVRSGESVHVSVADSGRGVPCEHRETVFEKFSQLGDTMTEKPPGAGLGLPICRRIIDLSNGAIWCEDSELGGASFRFLLPAVDPEQS